MPTIYGESIVLSILDNGNIQKDIENIGFEDNTLNIISKPLQLNQGLILVTGPHFLNNSGFFLLINSISLFIPKVSASAV